MMRDMTQEVGKKLDNPKFRIWGHSLKGEDDLYWEFDLIESARLFKKLAEQAVKEGRAKYIPEKGEPLVAYKGFEMSYPEFLKYKSKFAHGAKPKFVKNKGWIFESTRHSLASKGIKTGRK